jgi:hypothetical protein
MLLPFRQTWDAVAGVAFSMLMTCPEKDPDST